MIPRYANPELEKIWSDENKTALWQRVELAAIQALNDLNQIPLDFCIAIHGILNAIPVDIDWWKVKETELQHDLNAFVEERRRHLRIDLQQYFHFKKTSYDIEEPAFALMLRQSIVLVESGIRGLREILEKLALRYRYAVMNGRSHGQEATFQVFGKRCLTWLQAINIDSQVLSTATSYLRYSKMSGAIGNYSDADPEVERKALDILGFEPFYGATQIMPREIYTPLAQALCQLVMTLNKIALDIRLGARSGRPICQEPFGKKQTGSSAMPHKKNTIKTEQMAGMASLAQGYLLAITQNIVTWEERAIEQSCVERVAWPDLFHVTLHCLKTMAKVLEGLRVYPDNMLLEIKESKGCYAANLAKDWLAEKVVASGLTPEDAYHIVQLAAFNAHEPTEIGRKIREKPPASFGQADELLVSLQKSSPQENNRSIEIIILLTALKVSPELAATQGDVDKWNSVLGKIFANPQLKEEWHQLFTPSHILQGEARLYQEILGV